MYMPSAAMFNAIVALVSERTGMNTKISRVYCKAYCHLIPTRIHKWINPIEVANKVIDCMNTDCDFLSDFLNNGKSNKESYQHVLKRQSLPIRSVARQKLQVNTLHSTTITITPTTSSNDPTDD